MLLCFSNLGVSTIICKFPMNNNLRLICEVSTLLQPFLNDGDITAFDKQGNNYKRVTKIYNFLNIHQETSGFPLWKKIQVNEDPTPVKELENTSQHMKEL